MAGHRRTKLEIQAAKILEAAREAGLAESFLFETCFSRYTRQLKLLTELEAVLDDAELLVSKEYVKGRENLYAHPAVAQYNSTADAANRTLATLLRIIEAFRPEEPKKSDPLLDYIAR